MNELYLSSFRQNYPTQVLHFQWKTFSASLSPKRVTNLTLRVKRGTGKLFYLVII